MKVAKHTVSFLTGAVASGKNANVILSVAQKASEGKILPPWARKIPESYWEKLLCAPVATLKVVVKSDSLSDLRGLINKLNDNSLSYKDSELFDQLVTIESFKSFPVMAEIKAHMLDCEQITITPTKVQKILASVLKLSQQEQAELLAAYQLATAELSTEIKNEKDHQAPKAA
jgi:hypothetical protein